MQTIFATGRIGKDAETRQAGNDSVCAFSLAVDQGYGERKTTNWFRCNVWGKRGATLQQYLTKGTKVAVQGELTIGGYDGKPQFDIRINEVDLMGGGEKQEARKADGSQGAGRTPAFDSDLDDDVPFVTHGGVYAA